MFASVGLNRPVRRCAARQDGTQAVNGHFESLAGAFADLKSRDSELFLQTAPTRRTAESRKLKNIYCPQILPRYSDTVSRENVSDVGARIQKAFDEKLCQK